MKVDSRTVTVAVAGLALSVMLGVLEGRLAGAAAGILTVLIGIVTSATVSIVLERRARFAVMAKRKQELLEMFAPPQPLNGSEDE